MFIKYFPNLREANYSIFRMFYGRISSGGAEMRVKITLACTECKQRNYNTVKNKKNTSEKLERSKYCPFCRKHTKHVETK